MFGNTMGWLISAVITAVAAFAVYGLVQAGIPTPATGYASTVKPLTLDARAALPPEKDIGTNAGDLYRDAIADYNAHSAQYAELQKNQDYPSAEKSASRLKGLDDLIKAIPCESMKLFVNQPDRVINFDAHPPDLEALDGLGKTAGSMIALAMYDKDYPVAIQYADAVLALGFHLYQERIAYPELSEGETLMGLGNDSLLTIAQAQHAASEVDIQQQFKSLRMQDFQQNIDPVAHVLFNVGDASIARHAGDMFEMATDKNMDRVWRVEAIRRVGRLRYNAAIGADQLKAPRILTELIADPKEDEIIHLAAKQALEMTAYENQAQR